MSNSFAKPLSKLTKAGIGERQPEPGNSHKWLGRPLFSRRKSWNGTNHFYEFGVGRNRVNGRVGEFKAAGLFSADFDRACQDEYYGTDESSLVERLEEGEVHVVQGSDRNIKITKPSDIELAQLYLAQESSEQTAS